MTNILDIDHLALYFSNLNEAKKIFIDGLGLVDGPDGIRIQLVS